jgi:hypothetical protein
MDEEKLEAATESILRWQRVGAGVDKAPEGFEFLIRVANGEAPSSQAVEQVSASLYLQVREADI